MKELYRRFISVIILLGTILVIMQFTLGFGSTFLSLNSLLTSTASSLLSSTNKEITQNINLKLTRMIQVGDQVAMNDSFKNYNRNEAKMAEEQTVNTELNLGKTITTLSSVDDFCDCCVIFSNGTYLGQVDAYTLKHFPPNEIYEYFSDLSERDIENFKVGKDGDYSRIYYSKVINSSSIILISILKESLDPIFYDAEENYNLTLRMTTTDYTLLYTGEDEEEVGSKLNEDLSQVIASSDHLQTILRGYVIASDTTINGWSITSTIPEDTLMGENKGLRSLYVILSAAIIILSGILLFFLCRQVKKRLTKIAEIEANLDDYSDIDNINING